jgi:hypothetical protein
MVCITQGGGLYTPACSNALVLVRAAVHVCECWCACERVCVGRWCVWVRASECVLMCWSQRTQKGAFRRTAARSHSLPEKTWGRQGGQYDVLSRQGTSATGAAAMDHGHPMRASAVRERGEAIIAVLYWGRTQVRSAACRSAAWGGWWMDDM